MNLYSGITFVVVIELCELLYHLIFYCNKKRKNKNRVIQVQEKPEDRTWEDKYKTMFSCSNNTAGSTPAPKPQANGNAKL